MRDLEREFAAAAAKDGHVYLPNFTPAGPVDAVLIAMEPSVRGWAPQRIAEGFRNFMWSPEAAVIHYTARRYLCSRGETYHITDISKGAMPVAKAHVNRRARYALWAPLLKKEIQLVAKPDAHIIAMGRQVCSFIAGGGLDREFKSIMHYSPLACSARNQAVKGREADFSSFCETLTMQHLIDAVAETMQENSVPVEMCEETIARLREGELSESLKKLAFIYATTFASWRTAPSQL